MGLNDHSDLYFGEAEMIEKTQLIEGTEGRGGSDLTESFLNKKFEVHGLVWHSSMFNFSRIDSIYVGPSEPGARCFSHNGKLANLEKMPISKNVYNK